MSTHAPALPAAADPLSRLWPPDDVQTLTPRACGQRPTPAVLWHQAGAQALAGQRTAISQAALRHADGPPHVVLYALTRADLNPHDALAATQGHATRHSFTVDDRIVDVLDGHGDGDYPTLQRGHARALSTVADPASPVRGVVAVSRMSTPRTRPCEPS
ncbi:hypothetical protein [Streptomyces chartreusis]|uniref:hypothetical protein n=1 Tax=Streptomyces chartreusis TaxID=1969 RepID=UPI002F91A1B0|nr:hypothetical protein OG938_44785 [Streptomyces chartreusis]